MAVGHHDAGDQRCFYVLVQPFPEQCPDPYFLGNRFSLRIALKEWGKIERLVVERGKSYKTAKRARKHLKSL